MSQSDPPLSKILNNYRSTSKSEREKGDYFEELVRTFLRYGASYSDLFSDVWVYAGWAKQQGHDVRNKQYQQ